MSDIKIGTCVLYRTGFGHGNHRVGHVTRIEQTDEPHVKYGTEVTSVPSNAHYVIDLDNGHWAYSHQVECILD